MDNSIEFKIMQKLDCRCLGQVRLSRDHPMKVISEKDLRLMPLLKEIFSKGVFRLLHSLKTSAKESASRVWIHQKVEDSSPDFFPAVIQMIENAGYEVRMLETKKRRKMLEQLKKLLKVSKIDEGYKSFMQAKMQSLTDDQITKLVVTFENKISNQA